MLAAKNGFNGVLGLMSTIYPISCLDSSKEYSILHLASASNYPYTVRYIVQKLHIDVNIIKKNGLTPLHYTALFNSLFAFNELLNLGGNPFISNSFNNMNTFDYIMKYCAREMINAATETTLFYLYLCSSDILIHLVMNLNAYPFFWKIINTIDKNAFSICDSNGRNLLSLACINNNRKVVSDLLMIGINPYGISFDDQNAIHICAENNSIGCSDLILKHISQND